MSIASNLVKLREFHGDKQAQIGRVIGLKQQTVSKQEKGDRSFPYKYAVKLAAYYGNVTAEQILGTLPPLVKDLPEEQKAIPLLQQLVSLAEANLAVGRQLVLFFEAEAKQAGPKKAKRKR